MAKAPVARVQEETSALAGGRAPEEAARAPVAVRAQAVARAPVAARAQAVARAHGARVQEETNIQEMARAPQVGTARAVTREPLAAAGDMAQAVGGDLEMATAQAGARTLEGPKAQEVGKPPMAMVNAENL